MQTAMHQKSCFSLSVSSCLPRGGFPPLLVEPPRGPWGDAQEVSLPDTSPTNEPCLSPEPRQLVFIPVFAQRPTVSKDVLLQLLGTSLFVFPFPFYFYFIFFLAIWHHQIILPPLLLHSPLTGDLATSQGFSRSCPHVSGTVVSSASSTLHPIPNLMARRKKKKRERNRPIKR